MNPPRTEAAPAVPAATRVAVVGAGNVGSTFAYALLLSGVAAEIVLVDRDASRGEGEAMDLAHAVPLARPARVWAGGPEECAGAAVTVITAGATQKDGETRLDLLERNAAVFDEVVPAVVRHNPDGLLLVATNPVDLLTAHAAALAAREAGVPHERVIGSGTILDTARFRALIGQHVGVDPRSVHAYVVGEHGDSEVPVWSSANVGGMPLGAFCEAAGVPYDAGVREAIGRATREAGYAVAERKGATYYAVAAGLLRIVEAVVRDQTTVLSVSGRVDGPHGLRGATLSLPTIVTRGGAARVLETALDDEERAALHRSAAVLAESAGRLGRPA
jgi:L-lactate dehydrogenase